MTPSTAFEPVSLYPVLICPDPAEAAGFYREALGFVTVFENEWYISLRLGRFELALLQAGHASLPPGRRSPVRGMLLNLEFADVRPVHDALLARGLEPFLPLRDEPWGQRHCVFEAPDGVLVDLIQPIEPSPEFAAAYRHDD